MVSSGADGSCGGPVDVHARTSAEAVAVTADRDCRRRRRVGIDVERDHEQVFGGEAQAEHEGVGRFDGEGAAAAQKVADVGLGEVGALGKRNGGEFAAGEPAAQFRE